MTLAERLSKKIKRDIGIECVPCTFKRTYAGYIQDLAKDIEQDATSVLVYKDKVRHLSEIRDGAYAIVGYVKELEKLVGEVGS